MKRLFLLIAVCMIGMVNVLAGFTVVPPEESGTGSYVLTFKETAGEGETLYDWSDISDNNGNNPGSLSYLSNATSISIVTEGNYKLTQTDVKYIIGSDYPRSKFPSVVTLDMGEALLSGNEGNNNVLLEAKPKNLTVLKTFVFPKNTVEIPAGFFSDNEVIEEVIMLDPDDLSTSHITIIPPNTFNGCKNLSSVRLPNGLVEIQPDAFKSCAFESISFPNTLTTIGSSAFAYCGNLKSVTIPYSVTDIGNSAFSYNYAMTDVYVLGNNVTIDDGAFNQGQTYNFKYEEDGSVDFTDWEPSTQGGGTAHPLVLHIPDNDEAYTNYINPFLRMLQDDLFDNDEISEGLKNITDHPEAAAAVDAIKTNYGFPQDYRFADYAIFSKNHWVTKENAFGKISRYFKEAGSLFNGNGNLVELNDYGGWRNFMLAEGDVSKKTWPDIRLVDSRWYSAVFPFDLSFNQVESAYGANTDVREFTNVWEHEVDNKLIRTVRFNTKPTIPSATSGGRSVDKNKAGYIKAGRPYMIHPGTRVEVITVGGEKVGRTIAGVNVDEADAIINSNGINSEGQNILETETVERSLVYDEEGNNKGSQKYYFKGTFQTQTLPANSFYLGYDPKNPTRWPLAFYVTTTDLAEKWSEFTSIVRKTNNFATDNSNAKSMGIDFTLIIPEEEIFGITTGIESVSDQKSVNNGIVYNLNGQIIGNQSTSNLSKGIYIVNGKKIVVR